MAFDFASLEPRIHQILSAPGTDLATISAKRVRRQLLEMDPYLTAEFLRENKEEVDTIIASVFERVSGEQGVEPDADNSFDNLGNGAAAEKEPRSYKRKQEEDDNDESYSKDGATPRPKKPKKSAKNGQEQSDAELARRLSSEINGRTTRTGNKGRSNASKKGGRTKKSAATVDSDDESEDGGKKKKKKSSGEGGAKGGFGKEFMLSEPLAALLQVEKLSRPQVVKQLWVYIKGNDLQNPKNKREILCDSSLRAVFNSDKIDMFAMNKVLGQHLYEIEDQS